MLVTNVLDHGPSAMSGRELLAAYKDQHYIKRNFGFLKDPVIVNSLFLKPPPAASRLRAKTDYAGAIPTEASFPFFPRGVCTRVYAQERNKGVRWSTEQERYRPHRKVVMESNLRFLIEETLSKALEGAVQGLMERDLLPMVEGKGSQRRMQDMIDAESRPVVGKIAIE